MGITHPLDLVQPSHHEDLTLSTIFWIILVILHDRQKVVHHSSTSELHRTSNEPSSPKLRSSKN